MKVVDAQPGDQIKILWPNGHGFDVFAVRHLDAMEGPEKQIIYVGSFEYTDNGNVIMAAQKDLRDRL